MLVNSGNKNGLYNHWKEDNGPIFHRSPSKNIEKALNYNHLRANMIFLSGYAGKEKVKEWVAKGFEIGYCLAKKDIKAKKEYVPIKNDDHLIEYYRN